nr:hypothetical protein BOSE7B_150160 [Bosea sp. 7B]
MKKSNQSLHSYHLMAEWLWPNLAAGRNARGEASDGRRQHGSDRLHRLRRGRPGLFARAAGE